MLGRQEERYYVERIKDQRSADAQLSRAISLMLDGRNPHLELALKSAYDEFHRSEQFLEKHTGVIARLVGSDGKVDFHRFAELANHLVDHGSDDATPAIVEDLDYAELTLAQLRARLPQLKVDDLEALLTYENNTKSRAPFQTLLANRITRATAK